MQTLLSQLLQDTAGPDERVRAGLVQHVVSRLVNAAASVAAYLLQSTAVVMSGPILLSIVSK
jgi:hypothetical protein